jgi:hypothetical protein
MLGAAFISMGAAHADAGDSNYFGFTIPDETSFTDDAGFPPLFQESSADGVSLNFDAADDHSGILSNADFSDGAGSGTIDADVDNLTGPLGTSSQTITLDDALTTDGVGAEDGDTIAGDGSVFNVTDIGLGFGNVYADAVGAGHDGSDALSDTLVTPLGNIDLSNLVDFTSADSGTGDLGGDLGGGDLFGGLFGEDGLFGGPLGGALLGGLAGVLLTGDTTGALIGAALGGLLGGDTISNLLGDVLGGGGLLGGLLGGGLLGGLFGGGDDGGFLSDLLGGGDGGFLSHLLGGGDDGGFLSELLGGGDDGDSGGALSDLFGGLL